MGAFGNCKRVDNEHYEEVCKKLKFRSKRRVQKALENRFLQNAYDYEGP